MKPDYNHLGAIGAQAASLAMGAIRTSAYLSIHQMAAHCEEDTPARTAFARAVIEEDRRLRMAEVGEGMPSAEDLKEYFYEFQGGHDLSWQAVRNLMLAAFEERLAEVKKESDRSRQNGLYLAIVEKLKPVYGDNSRDLEWDLLPSTIGHLSQQLNNEKQSYKLASSQLSEEIERRANVEFKLAAAEKRLEEAMVVLTPFAIFGRRVSDRDDILTPVVKQGHQSLTIAAFQAATRVRFPAPTAEQLSKSEFLKLAKSKNWNVEKLDGEFITPNTRMAFEAWQARASKEAKA